MSHFTRRCLLQAFGGLSLLGVLPAVSALGEGSQPKGSREFDISKYDFLLLPREHGQLLPRNAPPVFRRYPSRDHCMQMAAFFNKTEGLLVIANDPMGGLADWEVRPGSYLKIHFYGDVPNVLVYQIKPTLAAAAAQYRQWAAEQFWVKNRNRVPRKLNFISVASSSSAKNEAAHLDKVMQAAPGPHGVWFTQWRKYPFDHNYPDYSPKEPSAFAQLLSVLRDRDATAMPYINAQLWDRNPASFKTAGNDVALRTKQLDTVYYNRKLDFLRYACPSSLAWQNIVVSARNNLKDTRGRVTAGVYLDMLAAAEPQICWAENHDHVPGDANAWQRGQRKLLNQINGAIMVEGCAEVYLDRVDYALMHLWTGEKDSAPLWHAVYGDLVQSVGWQIPGGIGPTQFEDLQKRVREFGVGAFGSPWMTAEPESALFARGLLTSPPAAPRPRVDVDH